MAGAKAPPALILPEEDCGQVAELGIRVFVRGMLLSHRLELTVARDDGFKRVSRMLAWCVVDEAKKPVYTVDEWEIFGARHFEVALDLWTRAQRLSGLETDPQKKG